MSKTKDLHEAYHRWLDEQDEDRDRQINPDWKDAEYRLIFLKETEVTINVGPPPKL